MSEHNDNFETIVSEHLADVEMSKLGDVLPKLRSGMQVMWQGRPYNLHLLDYVDYSTKPKDLYFVRVSGWCASLSKPVDWILMSKAECPAAAINAALLRMSGRHAWGWVEFAVMPNSVEACDEILVEIL